MKVAIYVRTSKRDMHPENQLIELERYSKAQGWGYDVYEEQETTRKTRPIKQDLMQKLRKREYEAVLVWKLDRWARSLQELIMDVSELINRNVGFIVLTQPIDTTSASGRLMLQILGAFAEFEREMIRERTIAGLERARSRGKKLGRPKKRAAKNRGGFPSQS